MKKILIAMSICSACVVTPASAQPYVGVGFGSSNTDTINLSTKIYGGYQLIPNFGFEVGYTDLGGYRGRSATSISLALTGTLPLGKTWDILGKVGASRNSTGSSSNMEPLISFGIGYNTSENVAIRLESENLGKLPTDSNNNGQIVSNVGLSANMKF